MNINDKYRTALRILGDLIVEYEANCPEKYSSSKSIAKCNDFFLKIEN